MNKNLKKVISTIAALAISASSFAAMATAISFPDVEETASYATAVKELVGLGIVNGYEDGTFGPDQLVTRAEITKMIVLALGMDSSATAASGLDTQFSDVTASHWASGYISVGVSQGFINGMGDGTFDPDSNVQFLQAEKMLVGACGYTTWAENAGGWPSGYSSYAAQLELDENIDGSPSNTTELNRGQVAQLIANALDAPVCVQNGYETNAWGQSVPKLEAKDGTGDEYQSLLIQKHDAYNVYGRVTANSRSNPGLDSDEVKFQVEKADNFDGDYIKSGNDDEVEITAYTGDSGAEDYLFEYSNAIIQETDDDDWEIIIITSSAKNDTVTFNADMYDYDNDSNTDYLMYVYTNDAKTKTTSYKLSGYSDSDDEDVVFYINGVEVDYDGVDGDIIATYITGNDNGTVTLIDSPATGSTSTDGRYDYVMITYYADATVDSVSDSSTPKITFDKYDRAAGMKSSLTVDLDDDDVDYTFTLDGEEIDVTDLAEDDVLSIAFDVTETFNDTSSFYEVLVSRDVVTGKVTAVDGTDGFAISGTYYEPNTSLFDDGDVYEEASDEYISGNITSGTEYTLYLNAFGKFVDYDEGDGSAKNLVVLDSLSEASNGNWYVYVWDQTGDLVDYQVKDSNVFALAQAIYESNASMKESNYDTTDELLDDIDTSKSERYHYSERVAEVSISTAGQLKLKSIKSATTEEDTAYKLKTNKIGSIKLSENSVILDFTDYDDKEVSVMSLSSLVDESEYTAYGYSKSNSDSTHRFVIIGEGGSDISGASSMAIFSSSGSTTTSDDEETVQLKVYVDGEYTYLVTEPDEYSELSDIDCNLREGAPFFYTVNGEGLVDKIYPIMQDDYVEALYDSTKNDESPFWSAVYKAAAADANGSFDSVLTDQFYDASLFDDKDTEDGAINFGTSSDEAYIHFGPVVDKTSSTAFKLARLNDTETYGYAATNVDNLDDYTFDSDVNAYVYDLSASRSKRLDVGSKGSIVKTTLSSYNYFDGSDKVYIDWLGNGEYADEADEIIPDYALIKNVEDSVTEMLVITNSDR